LRKRDTALIGLFNPQLFDLIGRLREIARWAGAETMLVSLDEADAGEDKVAGVADDDVEIEAGDETLLEEEEEDADDVGILLVGEIGDEEER
jgi:hypothetical protein